MTQADDLQYFDFILRHLQQTRGFDFTTYKRQSLMRRLLKRMETVGLTAFGDYFAYLQVHQEECAALLSTILINVTSFFRDPDVWEYMRTTALPQILAARGANEPLRVWSAGCASGQEAYTALMLLGDLLGADAVRERVKIYATDADEDALNQARLATYSAKDVEQVPSDLLGKYFDRSGASYTFRRELRETVIFGRHDLVQDPPISRVDLLVCRNTLMYFNADAQERILARFFFSLNPSGHILLGRAEMLSSHSTMFRPVDLKRRLFTVVRNNSNREKLLPFAHARRNLLNGQPTPMPLRKAGFEGDPLPRVVVDVSGAQELETAYEELQSTNEELRTTNEELQSAVEELETTNEELQSRNEELETINEGLQFANRELQAMNDELRNRIRRTA